MASGTASSRPSNVVVWEVILRSLLSTTLGPRIIHEPVLQSSTRPGEEPLTKPRLLQAVSAAASSPVDHRPLGPALWTAPLKVGHLQTL